MKTVQPPDRPPFNEWARYIRESADKSLNVNRDYSAHEHLSPLQVWHNMSDQEKCLFCAEALSESKHRHINPIPLADSDYLVTVYITIYDSGYRPVYVDSSGMAESYEREIHDVIVSVLPHFKSEQNEILIESISKEIQAYVYSHAEDIF